VVVVAASALVEAASEGARVCGRGTHAGFLVARDGTAVLGDDLVGD